MASSYEVSNKVKMRNIWGSAPGGTVSQMANVSSMIGARPPMAVANQGAMTPTASPAPAPATEGEAQVQEAGRIGLLGKPLTFWLVMFLALLGLMYGAKRLGTEEDKFANIQLSAHNILIISFASILGINFFKVLFTRFPVPGLTTLVNAV